MWGGTRLFFLGIKIFFYCSPKKKIIIFMSFVAFYIHSFSLSHVTESKNCHVDSWIPLRYRAKTICCSFFLSCLVLMFLSTPFFHLIKQTRIFYILFLYFVMSSQRDFFLPFSLSLRFRVFFYLRFLPKNRLP